MIAARTGRDLRALLARLDGRPYKAYRDLEGRWELPGATLFLDRAQRDPFAPASRVRLLLAPSASGYPGETCASPSRRVGVAAFLARAMAAAAKDLEFGAGSGNSGRIVVAATGQEVMPQSAVEIDQEGGLEARFRIGLPGRGRRILGEEAGRLLLDAVPTLVATALVYRAHDPEEVWRHGAVNENADALRGALSRRGLVAFVADGAVLPRRSGADDGPMTGRGVVTFRAPGPLAVEMTVPHGGTVRGLGLPRGVTLITGGGFHGKTTLLRALERGVYNHRPGDGREQVVCDARAIKIRAEDGRSVRRVDISAFMGRLPGGATPRRFTTENASGATSQAASIMEALEMGARALLIDEDTAATNFMVRDRRMQALIPAPDEPITPLVDRVRELFETQGVSTILVMGGCGDYLDVADRVVAMRDFEARDATAAARRVAAAHPTGRQPEARRPLRPPEPRRPIPGSIDLTRGRRRRYVRSRGSHEILIGPSRVDLVALEQLVMPGQARAVALAVAYAVENLMDGRRPLAGVVEDLMHRLAGRGYGLLEDPPSGELAQFRDLELAAALNRIRTLEVTTDED